MTTRCRIKIVGVGGAGCNALNTLSRVWPDGPDMAVIHSDPQVLHASVVPDRVLLDELITGRHSTGGDPEIGHRAAEATADRIRTVFEGVDLAFLVTGLGGGTGTGAAPVVCRLAREAGALTIAFCTLPFFFEGQARRQRAEEAIGFLRQTADAVVALPNQRLADWVGENTSLVEAFQAVDQVLAVNIRAVWRIMSQTGLINLDFADLQRLVRLSGGTCSMACAEAEGANRAQEVVESLMQESLLDRGQILSRANALLIGITGGPDMTLNEIQKITTGLTSMTRPNVPLHFGTAIDGDFAGRLFVTVLAAEGVVEPAAAPASAAAPDSGPAIAPDAPTSSPAEDEGAAGESPSRRKAGRSKPVQATLPLEPPGGKGRFANVEATVFEGLDLDEPAFMRRRIRIGQP